MITTQTRCQVVVCKWSGGMLRLFNTNEYVYMERVADNQEGSVDILSETYVYYTSSMIPTVVQLHFCT